MLSTDGISSTSVSSKLWSRESNAKERPTRLLDWAQGLMHALAPAARDHVVDSMLAPWARLQLASVGGCAQLALDKGVAELKQLVQRACPHRLRAQVVRQRRAVAQLVAHVDVSFLEWKLGVP